MATLLGKRKRRVAGQSEADPIQASQDQLQYQEVMRRHFETSFAPVESKNPVNTGTYLTVTGDEDSADSEAGTSDSEITSDWEGFSKESEVQIVSHDSKRSDEDNMEVHKSLRKTFMGSRPPKDWQEMTTIQSTTGTENKKLRNAGDLTAEDLALQRLLAESHLLSGSTTSTLLPTLKARQAAQDLRLQKLGAKRSVDTIGAGNMPMAIRKGIESKKHTKERNRRREAKESGIVLEKEIKFSDKDKRKKRIRDVGAPAVGKWHGGTLVLGKRDVAEIENQRFGKDFMKRSKRGAKGHSR